MKIYNQPIELIIDMPSVQIKSIASTDLKQQLAKANVPVEKTINRSAPLSSKRGVQAKKALTPVIRKQYIRTKPKDTDINPWDAAHQATEAMPGNTYIEPDIFQEFTVDKNGDEKPYSKISKRKWAKFRDAVIAHPGASIALKKYLMATHTASKKSSSSSAIFYLFTYYKYTYHYSPLIHIL